MRASFSDPVQLTLPMTLSPDSSGDLVVPVGFNANRYHRGEPYELQLRSSDETVHAVAKVFPFPILARQDDCRVWVEFVKDDFKEVRRVVPTASRKASSEIYLLAKGFRRAAPEDPRG